MAYRAMRMYALVNLLCVDNVGIMFRVENTNLTSGPTTKINRKQKK